MEKLTLKQLLEAVNGTLLGDFANLDAGAVDVCTDSRSITPGCLFIPLEGERFDGHSFINSALEAGAAGCLTAREREGYLPGKFYIKVRSTQRALWELARYYKGLFPIPFVAITGSVGKTTTKDMTAAVLGARPVRGFFAVSLPELTPGILSSLSMAFILSYSQYFTTLIVGGGRVKTLALVLVPYIQGGDRSLASVYALAFTGSALVVFALFEALIRRWQRGGGAA